MKEKLKDMDERTLSIYKKFNHLIVARKVTKLTKKYKKVDELKEKINRKYGEEA